MDTVTSTTPVCSRGYTRDRFDGGKDRQQGDVGVGRRIQLTITENLNKEVLTLSDSVDLIETTKGNCALNSWREGPAPH